MRRYASKLRAAQPEPELSKWPRPKEATKPSLKFSESPTPVSICCRGKDQQTLPGRFTIADRRHTRRQAHNPRLRRAEAAIRRKATVERLPGIGVRACQIPRRRAGETRCARSLLRYPRQSAREDTSRLLDHWLAKQSGLKAYNVRDLQRVAGMVNQRHNPPSTTQHPPEPSHTARQRHHLSRLTAPRCHDALIT